MARGNQSTVGCQHEAAQLGKDGHIAHPGGHQDLLIGLVRTPSPMAAMSLAALVRAVGNAHAAGQVDEADLDAGALAAAPTASSNRMPASLG